MLFYEVFFTVINSFQEKVLTCIKINCQSEEKIILSVVVNFFVYKS